MKINENLGYNPSKYMRGTFSGKTIGNSNVTQGPLPTNVVPDPVEDLVKKVIKTNAIEPNGLMEDPNAREGCPSCAQLPETCGCKGNCLNCGQENGGCDCNTNQGIEIGDIVRNVNPECPDFKTSGRVIEMPDLENVIYSVITPGGSTSIGQLLNKSMDQLTVDEKYKVR